MKRRRSRRHRPTTQRPRDIPALRAARPRTVLVHQVAELRTVPLRTPRTVRRRVLRAAVLDTVRLQMVRMARPPVAHIRAVLEVERGVRLLREPSPVIRRPRGAMKYMPLTVA
jgi:hypothetical protein